MQLLSSVVAVLAFGSHALAASLAKAQARSPGFDPAAVFTDSEMIWIGSKEPGGPNVTFRGHHTDVAAMVAELNPWWLREGTFENGLDARGIDSGDTAPSTPVGPIHCVDADYGGHSSYFYAPECSSIAKRFGKGYCVVDPGKCSQFACSYGDDVRMCTYASVQAVIPCNTLANQCIGIYNYCGEDYEGEWVANRYYTNPQEDTILGNC